MTAAELQNIARLLSNQCWCRHWLNFYNTHNAVDMAIHCIDHAGKPERVPELEQKGFRRATVNGLKCVYLIPRTNDDGTPYVTKLF